MPPSQQRNSTSTSRCPQSCAGNFSIISRENHKSLILKDFDDFLHFKTSHAQRFAQVKTLMWRGLEGYYSFMYIYHLSLSLSLSLSLREIRGGVPKNIEGGDRMHKTNKSITPRKPAPLLGFGFDVTTNNHAHKKTVTAICDAALDV